MDTWAKIAIGIAAIAVILLHIDMMAQDQDYSPVEIQETGIDGINSGWVVAYGVPVLKPYKLSIRDDTVFINDIPYDPAIFYTNLTDTIPMEVKLKFERLHRLESLYVDCYMTSGRDSAVNLVEQEFERDTLTSKMVFTKHDNPDLMLTWWDGEEEAVLLHSLVMGKQGYYPSRNELQADLIKSVRGHLRNGGMIAFGNGYHRRMSPESAHRIFKIVEDVKSQKLPKQTAQQQLEELVIPIFGREVINNIDKWSAK
jgi:hypothetical protein